MNAGFKTKVFVKFKNNQSWQGTTLPPLKEARADMMQAVKDFFSEEHSPEQLPWLELATALWHTIPAGPTFKPSSVMIKLKNIVGGRGGENFKFTVQAHQRPQFCPNSTDEFYGWWSEPESDLGSEEETELLDCFDVSAKVLEINTLEKACAEVVAGKVENLETLIINGRMLPKNLIALVQALFDENIDD